MVRCLRLSFSWCLTCLASCTLLLSSLFSCCVLGSCLPGLGSYHIASPLPCLSLFSALPPCVSHLSPSPGCVSLTLCCPHNPRHSDPLPFSCTLGDEYDKLLRLLALGLTVSSLPVAEYSSLFYISNFCLRNTTFLLTLLCAIECHLCFLSIIKIVIEFPALTIPMPLPYLSLILVPAVAL